MSRILYKYLDAKGGFVMMNNCNLRFTNADDLNDPFDCHPSLIDESILKTNNYPKSRYNTLVCSLSEVNNSILMWSYYSFHKGICIGIDIDKAKPYFQKIIKIMDVDLIERKVQYKNIIKKPDSFRNYKDMILYQLSTKAKEWKHEQEVRLVVIDPISSSMNAPTRENTIYVSHAQLEIPIGGECFESLYMGINIDKTDKDKIVNVAKEINPKISIYQMKTDTEAFRIKAEML